MIDLAQKQAQYKSKLIAKQPKSEVQLQNKCVECLQIWYPQHAKRLVCVNNNDKHTNCLNIGIVDGASDTYWLSDKGRTIYIEFKFCNNVQTKNQKEWEQLCLSLGHTYVLCYTFETFWQIVGLTYPTLSTADTFFNQHK